MLMRLVLSTMLVLTAAPAAVRAQSGAAVATQGTREHWNPYKPDQIVWQDGPASLLPGAKVAILEGDPTKEEFFTIRLKLPDGFRVYPHWHPKTERLTVIAGVVNLGTGDTFDVDSKTVVPLVAGSYSTMTPKMAHFAWMTGESILQLSSIGPWEVVYVNPADDPRIRK
jgi:hypothetical protein